MAVKKSLKEKEAELIDKIHDAKQKLSKLQQKRKIEIGQLAMKYGLDQLDNAALEAHFKTVADGLAHANA